MLVYTYCSYKGSHKGYQYAFFDTSKKEDMKHPIISIPIEDTDKYIENTDIFKECKDWFQNKHGWKMVLKKTNEAGRGILLISKIEEDMQEQIFFINIAFVCDIKKLTSIAAHYINGLIYSEPYSSIWAGHMEKFLEKTEDNEKYQINRAEYNSLLKEILDWSSKERNKIKPEQSSYSKFSRIIKQLPFGNEFPLVRLKWEKNSAERYRERKEKAREQIVNRLLQQTEYKEDYILLVSDTGKYEELLKILNYKVDMALDMGYIRKHYIPEE